MLGKVMKYEFRSAGRLILPYFGLAIVISGVLRLMLLIAGAIWAPAGMVLGGIATSLGGMLLFAVVIMAFVVLVVRFYQSMNGREAYLTFTLPVKPGTQLWGRLIVSTVYTVLSCVVAVACGFIFIPGFAQSLLSNADIPLEVNGQLVGTFSTTQLSTGTWLSVYGLIVALALVTVVSNLLKLYASFAIGTRLGPNRVVGSILGYVILNVAETLLVLPLIVVPIIAQFTTGNALINRLMGDVDALLADMAGTVDAVLRFAWILMGIVAAFTLVLSVVHFLLCRYFYGKRLNLE